MKAIGFEPMKRHNLETTKLMATKEAKALNKLALLQSDHEKEVAKIIGEVNRELQEQLEAAAETYKGLLKANVKVWDAPALEPVLQSLDLTPSAQLELHLGRTSSGGKGGKGGTKPGKKITNAIQKATGKALTVEEIATLKGMTAAVVQDYVAAHPDKYEVKGGKVSLK